MAAEQVQVKRLHALTALRFVAAFMIVLHHSRGVSLLPTNTAFFGLELYQAVAFFFVLSGFILTYVYPKFDSWNDRGRFLFARFARIWPAHVASFILLVLLMLHCSASAGAQNSVQICTDDSCGTSSCTSW